MTYGQFKYRNTSCRWANPSCIFVTSFVMCGTPRALAMGVEGWATTPFVHKACHPTVAHGVIVTSGAILRRFTTQFNGCPPVGELLFIASPEVPIRRNKLQSLPPSVNLKVDVIPSIKTEEYVSLHPACADEIESDSRSICLCVAKMFQNVEVSDLRAGTVLSAPVYDHRSQKLFGGRSFADDCVSRGPA